MKNLILLFLSNYLLTFYVSQTFAQNDQDSIKFYQFLDKFKEVELPIDYSLTKAFFNGEKISKENLEFYICDYGNFCFDTYRRTAQRYFYNVKFKTNENFFVIVYTSSNIDQLTQNVQVILVTYAKKDYKKIAKLVLWGTKEGRYLIHSKINNQFEIESTTIYTYENDDNPYNDKHIFRIEEIKSKYIIDNSGQIIKLEESYPVEYPAKYIFDKSKSVPFIYPVDVKNK